MENVHKTNYIKTKYIDKKIEFLELLKSKKIDIKHIKDTELFNNGEKIKVWWNRYKYRIISDKDSVSREIIKYCSSVLFLTPEQKRYEFFQMLENNLIDLKNITNKKYIFTDNSSVNGWYVRNMSNIKSSDIFLIVSKKQEFIRKINKNFININNINLCNIRFKDKEKLNDYWNREKQNILSSNKKIDKDIVNALFSYINVVDSENIKHIIKLIVDNKLNSKAIHRSKAKLPNGNMLGVWFIENYHNIYFGTSEEFKQLQELLVLNDYKFIETNTIKKMKVKN